MKNLHAGRRRRRSSFSSLLSLVLPLQLLLVPEAGVESELLVVTDAPELGVRVSGVAELEGGGLLFFVFLVVMVRWAEGDEKRERKKNVAFCCVPSTTRAQFEN